MNIIHLIGIFLGFYVKMDGSIIFLQLIALMLLVHNIIAKNLHFVS